MAINSEKVIKKFERAQDSLVIQSSDLSLETIAQMVDSSAIDVAPSYQRRERWKPKAQAELIESFLLNVPVPPVYLAEDDFGTYSVIDGKQRITAIHRFLRNKLSLGTLSRFVEVNDSKFSDLPKQLQNALSIRPYIRVVTLLKQTDPELKYEVFTRLNSRGQPLLPQEIRNALYRGQLNDLLFELGENLFLRKQLKISSKKESAYTEMLDVEMPLRFLVFREQWKNFNGDSRRSMDDFMARHKKIRPAQLAAFKKDFTQTIKRCEKLWGDIAFKRYANNGYRDQFLAAIYDAQMIAAAELSNATFEKLVAKQASVIAGMRKLFSDGTFEEAVRASTNTPSRVKYRIEKVKEMLGAI
jgi:hypothetical protein